MYSAPQIFRFITVHDCFQVFVNLLFEFVEDIESDALASTPYVMWQP